MARPLAVDWVGAFTGLLMLAACADDPVQAVAQDAIVAAVPDVADEETPPPEAVDPSDAIFDTSVVHAIALEIAPAELQALHDALPTRIYVPATFHWGDITLSEVAVRYKGNSSSNPDSPYKRSFLIKFGEYIKGQRFLGLRRLALDNGIQFGSLFSERLVDDVLAQLGVPVSRSSYVALTLNGAAHGVYVNVERIDKSFMERRFGSGDGLLYKLDTGGAGAALELLPTPDDYQGGFESKSSAADTGWAALRDLCVLLDETEDDALVQALETALNLDAFIDFTAVAVFAGAFDQYTGWNPHNYYLHRDQAGRWTYLPWDLDVGLADNAFQCIPVLDGWNAAWPLPKLPRPLLERILHHPELLARYRQRAGVILEEHFHPDKVHARLDALYALIGDALKDDPFPAVRATNPEDTGYDSIIASMKAFAGARYHQARAELDVPQATAPLPQDCGSPGQPNGQPPPPGALTELSPTELAIVKNEPGAIALTWTNNAPNAGGTIVQRCTGEACESFANHIGLPGNDHTETTDTKALTAGLTYRYRVYMIVPVQGGPQGTGVSNAVTAVAQ